MTYNVNTPNAAQSPGLFPPQNNANFTRLKTIIGTDHLFNDAGPTADGFHKQATLIARAKPSGSLPTGTNGILYAFVDAFSRNQLGFYNGNANFQITPGIIAAVNFDGTGTVSTNQTIRSQLNVTSVFKNATGDYTVTFTTPIANNNYIVQLTGMRATAGGICGGQVKGDPTYGNSVSTTSIKIQFNGGSSSLNDVLMGNLIVVRYL